MSELQELAKRTYETSASILDQAKRLSKHVEASGRRLEETEVEVVALTYEAEKQVRERPLTRRDTQPLPTNPRTSSFKRQVCFVIGSRKKTRAARMR